MEKLSIIECINFVEKQIEYYKKSNSTVYDYDMRISYLENIKIYLEFLKKEI